MLAVVRESEGVLALRSSTVGQCRRRIEDKYVELLPV